MTNGNIIEWVRLDADRVLVATATRAWVLPGQFEVALGIFAGQMVGEGSVPTTTRLLEGAVTEAKSRIRLPHWPKHPLITLALRCHMAHATSLFMGAAARFYADNRSALGGWAAMTARLGRDRFAAGVSELRSFSRHADERSFQTVVTIASALTEYLRNLVQGSDPMACIGYVYAMDNVLCITSQGSIATMVAVLEPAERSRIALAAHETTLLYGQLCGVVMNQNTKELAATDRLDDSPDAQQDDDVDVYSRDDRQPFYRHNASFTGKNLESLDI